jgi:hypothetical protein
MLWWKRHDVTRVICGEYEKPTPSENATYFRVDITTLLDVADSIERKDRNIEGPSRKRQLIRRGDGQTIFAEISTCGSEHLPDNVKADVDRTLSKKPRRTSSTDTDVEHFVAWLDVLRKISSSAGSRVLVR